MWPYYHLIHRIVCDMMDGGMMIVSSCNTHASKTRMAKKSMRGDIVLCERNITPSIDKYTYIVGWNAEDARFNFIYKDGWSEIDACDHIFMEVIGNIYEDPELLEVK